jgi:hypothetical protein
VTVDDPAIVASESPGLVLLPSATRTFIALDAATGRPRFTGVPGNGRWPVPSRDRLFVPAQTKNERADETHFLAVEDGGVVLGAPILDSEAAWRISPPGKCAVAPLSDGILVLCDGFRRVLRYRA